MKRAECYGYRYSVTVQRGDKNMNVFEENNGIIQKKEAAASFFQLVFQIYFFLLSRILTSRLRA